MMHYKYLGIINSEKFTQLNDEERLSFLKEKNLVVGSYNVFKDGLPEPDISGQIDIVVELCADNYEYHFAEEIGLEIKQFLLKRYPVYLGADIVVFQRDFEADIYGLSKEKRKEKGLKYFNKYFYECCDKSDRRMVVINGEYKLESIFKTLERKRNELAISLRYEKEIVGQYLIGNENYFNRELYEHNNSIKEIFILENNFQILKYLNNKFGFENLEKFKISNEVFKNNENKFSTIKVANFIESVFLESKYKERKYGLALFYCLKNELGLINHTAEDFKNLCNNSFDCNFKNLRLGQNSDSHISHVEHFKKKWENFNN